LVREADRRFWIVCGEIHECADARHALALLRARRKRPCGQSAKQRDEHAPFHRLTPRPGSPTNYKVA